MVSKTKYPCRKVSETKCVRLKKCMYARGTQRQFCRKTGAKSCKGKTVQQCSTLSKCLFTKGNLKYCRNRTVKKR